MQSIGRFETNCSNQNGCCLFVCLSVLPVRRNRTVAFSLRYTVSVKEDVFLFVRLFVFAYLLCLIEDMGAFKGWIYNSFKRRSLLFVSLLYPSEETARFRGGYNNNNENL